MALTIPDYANAPGGYIEASGPDSVDFDAIVAGFSYTGVAYGLAVSQRGAGANMSVDVSAGSAYFAGAQTTLGGVSNQAITADGSNPRWVLVSFGSGAVTITHGTAAASPVFPAIPANKTLLAAIWVPAAAASILNANIVDKRIILSGFVDLANSQTITGDKTFTGVTLFNAGLSVVGDVFITAGSVTTDRDVTVGRDLFVTDDAQILDGAYRSFPRGLYQEARLTANSTSTFASTTYANVVGTISIDNATGVAGTNLGITWNAIAGRTYHVTLEGNATSTVAGDVVGIQTVKTGTATGSWTGTLSGQTNSGIPTATFHHLGEVSGVYYCTVAGTVTITVQARRSSGTGTITINGQTALAVRDDG